MWPGDLMTHIGRLRGNGTSRRKAGHDHLLARAYYLRIGSRMIV